LIALRTRSISGEASVVGTLSAIRNSASGTCAITALFRVVSRNVSPTATPARFPANPGTDFSNLNDVLLLVAYYAAVV
jgi:hypothetical protein